LIALPPLFAGFLFWRASARKFYAVAENDLVQYNNETGNRRMSKRKRMSDDLEETWRRDGPANFSESLDTLLEEVSEIKSEIGKFRENWYLSTNSVYHS